MTMTNLPSNPTVRDQTSPSKPDQVSFTIPEIRERNKISQSFYHKLKNEGRGPTEMRLSPLMIRVTAEAERAWHEALSNPSGAEAARRAKMEKKAVQRARQAARLSVLSARHPANVKRGRRSMLAGAQSRDQELAAARVRKSEGTA
jgi:hypothetical protein